MCIYYETMCVIVVETACYLVYILYAARWFTDTAVLNPSHNLMR